MHTLQFAFGLFSKHVKKYSYKSVVNLIIIIIIIIIIIEVRITIPSFVPMSANM
jgi:hypothetical protein